MRAPVFAAAIVVAASFVCSLLSADPRPDSHAPIGVMGEHVHKRGEVMVSYRFMQMSMEGNLLGSDGISPEEIVTTIPNVFAGAPGQPPTLRVVPTEMTMEMHMFGVMWATSDRITLMGMLSYIDKEMDHVTFAGPSGTTRLGTFTTESSGAGDTSVAALIRLNDDHHSRWHATAGISLPTGSIDETDRILTPAGAEPSPRLPYPMQLGSGSFDPIVGVTYAADSQRLGWGSQWRSVFRLGENDGDYTLGDEHRLGVWGSALLSPKVSVSARLEYVDRGNIDGADARIALPVQTADPDRQAIERIDAGVGLNVVMPGGRHRLAFELLVPVNQDLDGPQLETDSRLLVGWQYTPR